MAKGDSPLISTRDMTDEEIRIHALKILKEQLGVDGLIRFLRLYTHGNGDYTHDRHSWADSLELDVILAGIRSKSK